GSFQKNKASRGEGVFLLKGFDGAFRNRSAFVPVPSRFCSGFVPVSFQFGRLIINDFFGCSGFVPDSSRFRSTYLAGVVSRLPRLEVNRRSRRRRRWAHANNIRRQPPAVGCYSILIFQRAAGA